MFPFSCQVNCKTAFEMLHKVKCKSDFNQLGLVIKVNVPVALNVAVYENIHMKNNQDTH